MLIVKMIQYAVRVAWRWFNSAVFLLGSNGMCAFDLVCSWYQMWPSVAKTSFSLLRRLGIWLGSPFLFTRVPVDTFLMVESFRSPRGSLCLPVCYSMGYETPALQCAG